MCVYICVIQTHTDRHTPYSGVKLLSPALFFLVPLKLSGKVFYKTEYIHRDSGGRMLQHSPVTRGCLRAKRDPCVSLRCAALRNNLKFLLQRTARTLGMSWGPLAAPWHLGALVAFSASWRESRWRGTRVGERWEGTRRRREPWMAIWGWLWGHRGPFSGKADVSYHLLAFCVIMIDK